ncbi:MAG TPA: hypothetical protein VH088_08090 [Terriglobales bacterium]|jgi:hypothetical protein|nr:hypothetical protein [Terriglobales bacterium]
MKTTQIGTLEAKCTQVAMHLGHTVIVAFALLSVWPSRAVAQEGHSHSSTMQEQLSPEQKSKRGALLKIVRDSTARFQNVKQAEYEGYALQFGCVSGDSTGAMGMHYVNGALVGSGVIDPTRPQIVIYEPTPSGRLKLIGADFLVLADQWNSDPTHTGPPELMGQLFHLFDAPNRFGLPAFYTLHVWAWKENPNGAFVNWHPNVSCEQFSGETPKLER